jgi:hypothetical protein
VKVQVSGGLRIAAVLLGTHFGSQAFRFGTWLMPSVEATAKTASNFDHRTDCRVSAHHRTCDGRWRGVVSLGFNADGKRAGKKVSGKIKAEVRDKLKEVHSELEAGVRRVRRSGLAVGAGAWRQQDQSITADAEAAEDR